jgi:hypothetical protein
MLAATHTDYAPWTLVNFNDQQVGRLTLLRNLLDRVPDTDLPLAEISWPPLGHEPLNERFGVLAPIADYPTEVRAVRDRREHHQGHHHHHHHGD